MIRAAGAPQMLDKSVGCLQSKQRVLACHQCCLVKDDYQSKDRHRNVRVGMVRSSNETGEGEDQALPSMQRPSTQCFHTMACPSHTMHTALRRIFIFHTALIEMGWDMTKFGKKAPTEATKHQAPSIKHPGSMDDMHRGGEVVAVFASSRKVDSGLEFGLGLGYRRERSIRG